MKSILQSVLLYAAVTRMQKKMDLRTLEILKSYIYTFWLLQFSEYPKNEQIDIRSLSYELWLLTIETFRESGVWSAQHTIVAETFLKEFSSTSFDSIERFAAITTVPVDLTRAKESLSEVYQELNHRFGNVITWHIDTTRDAEVARRGQESVI